jgi:hypothetical protein
MTGMVYQRLTPETPPCGDADPSRQFLDDIEENDDERTARSPAFQ